MRRILIATLLLGAATPAPAATRADLTVAALAPERVEVESGARFTLTATLSNVGLEPADGVVSVGHPPGSTGEPRLIFMGGPGLSCNVPLSRCEARAMGVGESRSLSMELAAPVTVRAMEELSIAVRFTTAQEDPDANPENNARIAYVRVTRSSRQTDLALTNAQTTVPETGTVTFAFDVVNRGRDDAQDVVVTVSSTAPPAPLAVLALTADGWNCSTSGPIRCSRPSLRANESSRLTFTVSAAAGFGWRASVGSDAPHYDPTDQNNSTHGSALGSGSDFEAILVPLRPSRVAGALGSVWDTSLRAFVDGDAVVDVFPRADPCSGILCVPQLPPLMRGPVLWIYTPGHASIPGAMLYARRETSSQLRLNLKVRELSRLATADGSELPVVRDREFTGGRIQLFPIRIDDRFRHTLRIYDAAANAGASVAVRVFDATTGRELSSTVETFVVDRSVSAEPYKELPAFPGYIQIGDLGDRARGGTEVRVEIEPLTPGQRLWAFVSTTNNATQQITLVTPQ